MSLNLASWCVQSLGLAFLDSSALQSDIFEEDEEGIELDEFDVKVGVKVGDVESTLDQVAGQDESKQKKAPRVWVGRFGFSSVLRCNSTHFSRLASCACNLV